MLRNRGLLSSSVLERLLWPWRISRWSGDGGTAGVCLFKVQSPWEKEEEVGEREVCE